MKNKEFAKSGGFTLIEMMIVVVIIGIFAAMAAPSFTGWIPKMKLKGDARGKVNLLRQARGRAIAENSQYGVYFDVGNSQVLFFKDTFSPELSMYDLGSDSLVQPAVACGTNITMSNCSFANNVVIFYANGSASTSGSIDLDSSEWGDNFSISVLASTGRIRLN